MLEQPPHADLSTRAALTSGSDDNFGARLRRLREKNNISQETLAKLLNVSKLSVWKWERRNVMPRQVTREAIANLFAVSALDLIIGTRKEMRGSLSLSQCEALAALEEIIAECRMRIATQLGTTPDKIAITVNL